MKQMLNDYGVEQCTMNIYCDNSNEINISKNLFLYSWTKHIEIHEASIDRYFYKTARYP